jgi:20S proteasome subunit beta 3
MDYNGGSVIAMVGKDCVAIASDLRLGNQALGISSNFQKVFFGLFHQCLAILITHQIFPVTDRIYVGLPGLATDVTTLWVCHQAAVSNSNSMPRVIDENDFGLG